MWALLIVASIGFKPINSWQMLVAGMQDDHSKTSICELAVPLKYDRATYYPRTMLEYLQINVNNSSALDLEKGGNNTASRWYKRVVFGKRRLGQE